MKLQTKEGFFYSQHNQLYHHSNRIEHALISRVFVNPWWTIR